jgi:hypothetical protein
MFPEQEQEAPLYLEQQNITNFHRNRAGLFNASELAVLMQKGKTTEFSVAGETYLQRLAYEGVVGYQVPDNSHKSAATAWGSFYEKEAISTMFGVEKNEMTFFKPDLNLAATPDGVFDNETYEVKCPYTGAKVVEYFSIVDTKGLKEASCQYYWQVIAQMVAADATCGHIGFYCPRLTKALGHLKFNAIVLDTSEPYVHYDAELLKIRLEAAFAVLKALRSKWTN